MAKFDVLGEPPTRDDIRSMRERAGSAIDTAANVTFFTPLPLVDLVVGAVAGGVDHLMHGAEREKLDPEPGAVGRDWTATVAAGNYVRKVKAQGRELLKGEVEALEDQVSMERTARYALSVGLGAVADFLKPKTV